MRLRFLACALLAWSATDLRAQEGRPALPTLPVQPVQIVQPVAAAEVANFLAGVPLHESSPLASLQRSRTYQEHVRALARLSQHYDRNYFSKMQAWSSAELAPRIPMRVPVYYFFGGPDAVSVLALFPDAPVYVLGGLESVGSIVSPNALPEGEVALGLDNLRKSTEAILSYGHFITKDMKAELDRTAFRGVLPLIYTFIALAGGEIVSTEYFSVGSGGSMQALGNSQVSHGALP